jgi:hypothetical protein
MRVGDDGHVSAVKVDTGRRSGDAIEILGAVDAAARFVRSGGAFITDGDLVRVTAAAAP